MELAHHIDRLQDENDQLIMSMGWLSGHELIMSMGWLSGHEPQLRIMIETYKR
jgi:hypothetical protein